MCDRVKMGSWVAIVLVLIGGAIHVIDAPDSFQEAAYKGWLFYLNGAGSLLAAYGIFRRQCWGWGLGFLVSAGSFGAYILSRTVGLPMIPAEPDAWFEPMGVASMAAEGAFLALCAWRALKKSNCD